MPPSSNRSIAPRRYLSIAVALLCASIASCSAKKPDELVIYVSLDSEFAEPILESFSKQTGIRVVPKFDAESTKTVGLTESIIRESDRPRCDLFWNNEILNTLRLDERGLLEAYEPKLAAEFPPEFRDPEHRWHGFAARARVLIVNTELLPEAAQWPRSISALADPEWKGKAAIAKPLFGTTASHAACLFAAWGEDRAKNFFRRVKANGVQIASGNRQVAAEVAAGTLAFGLTDTDDAVLEIEAGKPVAIVFPDQEEGELGTLFIPNTIAIIKGGPQQELARRVADYLLSPAVEERLAAGESAQIPLNPAASAEAEQSLARRGVLLPLRVRVMKVDFAAAAQQWDTAAKFLREEFAN